MGKRYLAAICALVLFSCSPLWAQTGGESVETRPLLITEVSTSSVESASAEYVEIYNPNHVPYPLECIDLQYAASLDEAQLLAWSSKIKDPGFDPDSAVPARGFGLIASDAFIEESTGVDDEEEVSENQNEHENESTNSDSNEKSQLRSAELVQGLVDENRSLRLVEFTKAEADGESEGACDEQTVDIVHDTLGWGVDAPSFEATPFTWQNEDGETQSNLPEQASVKRLVDEDSLFIDTDINADDFLLSDDPNPQLTPSVPDTEDEEVSEEGNSTNNTNDDEDTSNDGDMDDDTSGSEDDEQSNSEEESDETDSDEVSYSSIEISELFVDPDQPLTDTDDEFVELHNPHNSEVDLSGYTIQAGSKLQYTHELDDITLQPDEYRAFDSELTGLRLANSGGRAQVLDPNGEIAASLVTYPEAETGQSYSYVGGEFLWTDNVTPNDTNKEPTPPEPDPEEVGEQAPLPGSAKEQDANQQSYPPVRLSELLPDPASPQSDSDDEFIELYNPNTFAVELDDYVLRSGSRGTTTHTIGDLTIDSNGFLAFFASDSSLTLSNSGITVSIEDPNGVVVDQQTYPKAKEGASWAKAESGTWQWTTAPTPAAANAITQEEEAASGGSSTSTSAEATDGDVLDAASRPATVDVTRADYRLIVGAAILALLYGLYEFRYDVYAYFRKLRDYFSHR